MQAELVCNIEKKDFLKNLFDTSEEVIELKSDLEVRTNSLNMIK